MARFENSYKKQNAQYMNMHAVPDLISQILSISEVLNKSYFKCIPWLKQPHSFRHAMIVFAEDYCQGLFCLLEL